MQPLLENKAGLRTKKVGMPKKVTVTLYNDTIELHDSHDDLELRASLSQIENTGSKRGIIYFTVQDHYFSIDFTYSLARTAAFSAFGGIGAAIGAATSPGVKIAQQWVYTMQQNGVRFQ